jgi:hypothetical protein
MKIPKFNLSENSNGVKLSNINRPIVKINNNEQIIYRWRILARPATDTPLINTKIETK